ncbi:AAA family ATPase [Desulfonema limicola]|uniref:AAA family ATPase n=1 Tax=Desulfonema limicola TaxID=45656 RepID=A0A975BCZ8_9BACT|nr:AAA family ATPase [Desulfonema limicola]QTA83015.1 AAA family ATPase [Desulfonema limicola]
MKLKKIELCNFRAVNKLSINLSEKLNVFVGVNGAGKSTIIDAIAITLSWLVNRIQRDKTSGRPIPEMSIRNGVSQGSITTCINKADTDYCWILNKAIKGNFFGQKSRLKEVSELATVIREEAQQTGLPVFAYYPVNRNVLDIPLRIRQKHSFEQFECFDEALTGAANFRHFFEWFRNREDLENESRQYLGQLDFLKPDNWEYPDRQLEAVRKSLEFFLTDFEHFSVRRNPLRV